MKSTLNLNNIRLLPTAILLCKKCSWSGTVIHLKKRGRKGCCPGLNSDCEALLVLFFSDGITLQEIAELVVKTAA